MLRMIPILTLILLVQADGNQKPEEAILEEDLNTTTTTTVAPISTRKPFNVILHPLYEKPEESKEDDWAMFILLIVVSVLFTACMCSVGFYIAGNRQVAPNDNRQPVRRQENIPLNDMN
ncbi:Protein CBG27296 [Caenorhabditis briggsae]|uniref:Uncharacterized protein n=2 Tax=Caenorhabditis briggsae TaxID=6238 RepID=A0AAE9D4G8_CAEBR|nr:Protein CBG27296 [Caenorhabditis briggsae]ULT92064.1 hypothetical protein L3Y34_009640 [Caenorhabditis briggsae]UMM37819.1 hypothetical protein L5515_009465 [Caenorhabditis briggsae]CAS01003.1 Protein CBG27296 [Caenorhabditis briggsae]